MGREERGRMSSVITDTVVDVLACLLSVVGIITNLLVLTLFYARPSLRSPSNRFVGSLVGANLVTAGGVGVCWVAGGWSHPWLGAGLHAVAASASAFSTLAIALDRHAAVLSPLHYGTALTRQKSASLICFGWAVSLAMGVPHWVLPCSSPLFWLYHSLVLLLLGFTVPLIALVLIYARMFAAAHRNSERTRRASECDGAGRRTSNSVFSAVVLREEGRAVRTGALVVGCFLLGWGPYFASQAAPSPLPQPLVLLTSLATATLNPLLYVFRNDHVRKETRRLVSCWSGGGSGGGGGGEKEGGGGGGGGNPPPRSSQCDSGSVHSFQASVHDPPCPPPQPVADFVATYHQVAGEANKYESVTFKLAQRRCVGCVRQNSDSSTGSGKPLLTPPPRARPSSEPTTPKHNSTLFQFQIGEEESLEESVKEPSRV